MQVNFNISLKEMVSWENVNYKMYLRRDSKPQQWKNLKQSKKYYFPGPGPKGHIQIYSWMNNCKFPGKYTAGFIQIVPRSGIPLSAHLANRDAHHLLCKANFSRVCTEQP